MGIASLKLLRLNFVRFYFETLKDRSLEMYVIIIFLSVIERLNCVYSVRMFHLVFFLDLRHLLTIFISDQITVATEFSARDSTTT